MIEKCVPPQTIIKILQNEIKEFGLPFAKEKPHYKASKTAFDNMINIEGIPSVNLKAMMNWGVYNMERKEESFIAEIIDILDADECTNTIYYSSGSFIDWHTNSDNPGIRTYILFTPTPGIFRYKTQTGEIVDDYDYAGWTMRRFLVDPLKPLWHCVYSPSLRFAYGFNQKI